MSAYRIISSQAAFNFEFWRGNPPLLVGEQIATHTRPGADGVGLQKIGAWEQAMDVTLEGWYASEPLALTAFALMKDLQGAEHVIVVYDQIDFQQAYGHDYFVERCDNVGTTVHPRLKGPGIDLLNGCKLLVHWRLIPRKNQ